MSYIPNDNVLDDRFFNLNQNENVGQNDDILDEFLDQRVYENMGFSPDKGEFLRFCDDLPENNQDSLNPNNYNYNSNVSPMNENDSNINNSFERQPRLDLDQFSNVSHNNSVHNLSSNNSSSHLANSLNNSPHSLNKVKKELGELSEYELLRNKVSNLKFGKYEMKVVPDNMEPDSNLLDFSPEAMAALPYSLKIANLPDYSRVETQIKLNFRMNPPPPQNLLHIPQDLVSKNKFCLSDDLSSLDPMILKNLLYMDCYVLTSNLNKSCNVCSKCIKREQKRASRRRLGGMDDTQEIPQISPHGIVKNNPLSWADDKMLKKAIIFNCKEIVSFPPPNSLSNNKDLELSARIICYCRHHQESEGFKLLFVIKNFEGEVLAKQLSSNIMIMDRKKPMGRGPSVCSSSNVNANDSATSPFGTSQSATMTPVIKKEHKTDDDMNHPISPNSIDESSDLTTNENGERNLKRKKLSIDDSNNSTNPMYNGSMNGFSPVSNSDTNTSITNQMSKNVYQKGPARMPESINPSLTNSPTILRIIPAEGPIRGGIEVTLLGFNFNSNLAVKFGPHLALATHCWSDTTIVTYLPPASQPGQVLVTFEDHEQLMNNQQQQIFTYTDDTDKQLIELALQIVGLKMNGKLEDAKNIAKRIVGNDSANNSPAQSIAGSSPTTTNHGAMEWYSNAQGIVERLTKMNYSTEEILVNFLKLVDMPNCPIIIPNWQLANNEGQTLLHLSTLKNYSKLIRFLINHGCKVDLQDNQGLTPLFYASINGQRDLISLYLNCKSNLNLRLSNDKTIKDYCDLNVMDMFTDSGISEYGGLSTNFLRKTGSLDSLNSMFETNGMHVSKMVPEKLDYDSEFADSEYSAEYDVSDYNEEISDISDEIDFETSTRSILNIASGHMESDDARTIKDENTDSNDTDTASNAGSTGASGIWQKVKNVFNNSDDDLPSYEDLFPFGPSSGFSKPKSTTERQLNRRQEEGPVESKEDLSDSSEDMIISYINHPRKTVENDKMLIFFWIPMLITIVSLFIAVSMFGYRFEQIEVVKKFIRDGLGNLMVGNERIKRVFSDSVRA